MADAIEGVLSYTGAGWDTGPRDPLRPYACPDLAQKRALWYEGSSRVLALYVVQKGRATPTVCAILLDGAH